MNFIKPKARTFFVLILLSASMALGVEVHVHGDKLSGRVFDSTNNRGVPGMIIRLTPPIASQEPERVARTGVNGEFKFEKVGKGKYLLQVYQGRALLFRRLINTQTNQDFVVALKRRS